MTNQVIPAQAVEAAAKAHYEIGFGSWESAHPDTRAVEMEDMRAALEAAAPHMLSHEREQTRLAHLDAMVNRETKQTELAEAWDRGHHDGAVEMMLKMENDGAKTTPNPYRPRKQSNE